MQVTFYEKVEAIDGTIQKILIGETEVPKEDGYIKLPENIYNSDKLIEVDVDVVDANGNIIIHDEVDLDDVIDNVPTGDTPDELVCERLCNGTTYAYTIQFLDETEFWNPTGKGVIRVNSGLYSDADYGTKNYRWMTSTEWNELKQVSSYQCGQLGNCSDETYENENTFAYYGLHNNYNGAVDGVNVKAISVLEAIDLELYDKTGRRITDSPGGLVYGIKKSSGAYKNHIGGGAISATSGSHYCGIYSSANISNVTTFANNMIRQNSNSPETVSLYTENPLFCKEATSLSGGGGRPTGVYADAWVIVRLKGPKGGGPIIGGDVTIFDQLATLRLSLGDDIPNTTDVPWWPGDNIQALRFYQVKKCATTGEIATHDWVEPITIYRDELKNEDGIIKNIDINFEKGLYELEFISDDYTYERVFFEADKSEKHSFTQSDYLTPKIYPVPLRNPNFDIEMEATAKVNFKYIVQNINGAVYYEESNITVNKGETMSRTISTENIPSFSTVIHRFEFSDGSVKTVTTQKF